jgi:hypothetical protein
MTTTAHTIRARKPFTCQGYRCRKPITTGELYARHVAFPNDEINQSPRPWVLRICSACQAPAAMPPFRVYRRRP